MMTVLFLQQKRFSSISSQTLAHEFDSDSIGTQTNEFPFDFRLW